MNCCSYVHDSTGIDACVKDTCLFLPVNFRVRVGEPPSVLRGFTDVDLEVRRIEDGQCHALQIWLVDVGRHRPVMDMTWTTSETDNRLLPFVVQPSLSPILKTDEDL